MARLHLKFRSINDDTVRAARALFDGKPWRLERTGDMQPLSALYQDFCNAAAASYHVSPPTVRKVGWDEYVRSTYNEGVITLKRWSVSTLFYGMREHLVECGVVSPITNPREDAHAWACSLWYTVSPMSFRAAVREGKVWGVYPDDLLTSEHLAELEATRAREAAEREAARRQLLRERGIAYGDWEEDDEDEDGEAPIVLDDGEPTMDDVVGPTTSVVEEDEEPAETVAAEPDNFAPTSPESMSDEPVETTTDGAGDDWQPAAYDGTTDEAHTMTTNQVAVESGRAWDTVNRNADRLGGRLVDGRMMYPPSAVEAARAL